MYFELLGVEHKSGTYNDAPYDNYNLHVSEPIDNDKGVGVKTSVIKVKTSKLADVFDVPFSVENIQNAIGHKIDVSYGRYDAVDKIRLNAD